MAITEIQRATATDDTNGGTGFISSIDVTLSSPPTDGNTLIICIMAKDANTPSITSVTSTNTTWVQAANISNGSNTDAAAAIYYATDLLNAGSTITVNLNSTRTVAVALFEYSEIDTLSPLDVTGTAGTTSSSSSGPLTISGTTNTDTDNQLAIAILSSDNDNPFSSGGTFVGSAFSQEEFFDVPNSVPSTSGRTNLRGLVTSKEIATSGTSLNVSLNANTGNTNLFVGALATFREAPLGKISDPDPSDGTTGVFPSKVLSWSAAPGGPTGYRVYVSENSDPTVDGYTVTGNTFFDPSDFNTDTTIYWRVDAYNDSEVVAGDVFSFTTSQFSTINPNSIASPNSGDRVFDSFNVAGTLDPGVGVSVEIIANGSLLFDGYTETDLDGDFSLPVEFTPSMANSKLFLNIVQTGRLGVSEELTITLFQARDESRPVVPYTARKLVFDDKTTALYTLSASTNAGLIAANAGAPTHELSFNDSGVPSGWAERNGDPVDVLGDGIMTALGNNSTDTVSALEDSSIDWTDGAVYSSSYRATTLSSTNDQPLVLFWRHVSPNIDNTLGHRMKNDRLDAVRIAHSETHQFVPDDQQNLNPGDWYDFQHYAKRLRDQLGTQHIYVETYVNGELYFTGFAGINGNADQVFLGQPFSSTTYSNFDINYFWAYQDEDPLLDGPFWSVDGDFNKAFDQSGNPAPSPTLGTTREGLEPPFATALEFNGTDEYLVNDNSLFELSSSFTIEIWFNRQGEDTSSSMRILGKEVSSSDLGYYIQTNGSTLRVYFGGSSVSTDIDIDGVIRNNTWYYCAVTYDNGTVKIYLDGIKIHEQTGVNYSSTTNDFYLGVDGTTTNVNFFQGQMAELRISDGSVRTEAEIYNNYFSNYDYNGLNGFPTDENTVANYNFANAPDYTAIESGNKEPITETEITFNSNEDFKKYFFPPVLRDVEAQVDAYVDNNKVVFSYEHVTGEPFTSTCKLPTKIILDKDFDFQAFITYENPLTPGGNSSQPIRIDLANSSGIQILRYFDRTNLKQLNYFRYSGSSIAEVLSQVPDKVVFRATCENNSILYRYDIDTENDATTEWSSLSAVSSQRSRRFVLFGNNIVNNAPSQTYQFTIDKLKISDREGNSPADGYAFTDPLLANTGYRFGPDVRYSKFGGLAPSFDGSTVAYYIDNYESLNTSEFTVEYLFAADSLQDSDIYFRGKDGYTDGEISISLNSSGDFTINVEDSNGVAKSMSNVGSYSVDKAHYIALTYKNKKFRFFVDGSQVGSVTDNFNNIFAHGLPFYIGADWSRISSRTNNNGANYFDGEIAHVRISNKARTPIEIFNFYRGAGLNE